MLGLWTLGEKALGQLSGSTTVLTVAAGNFALAGAAAAVQVQEPEATGSCSLAGQAARLQALQAISSGSFTWIGNTDAFETLLLTALGAFALSGSEVAEVDVPLGTGSFICAGIPADLSYDLLGGGGVIAGGTFSRHRWREMLDAIAQAREAEARRAREAALRRQVEQRRRHAALLDERALARRSARAAADEQAAALAAAHGEAVLAGLMAMCATAERAAAGERAAQAAQAAAQARAAAQDEDDALILLMAA